MVVGVGDMLELEVTKVVHGGDGLARHEGFVIFVHSALPGESVVARVYSVKKSHAFAELIDITVPSAQRVQHIWPEADVSRPPENRAGGADYGHIDLSAQRTLKGDILREALTRHGHVDPEIVSALHVETLPGNADGSRWRTRVNLHVGPDGVAGPYAERSHRVIPVQSLPLATSAIEHIGVHQMDWSGHQNIRITHPQGAQPRIIIDQQKPHEIREQVGTKEFVLHDQSFWQVHHDAAATLQAAVIDVLEGVQVDPKRTHYDLYAGVGLFAAGLANQWGENTSLRVVESDHLAAQYARRNLAGVPRAEVFSDTVSSFLRHHDPESAVGAVVIDPPRAGAKEAVVRAVAALSPQVIIYVACDPVALGRDVKTFRDVGYELTGVRSFDLFPHTHHVEALAVLTRQA